MHKLCKIGAQMGANIDPNQEHTNKKGIHKVMPTTDDKKRLPTSKNESTQVDFKCSCWPGRGGKGGWHTLPSLKIDPIKNRSSNIRHCRKAVYDIAFAFALSIRDTGSLVRIQVGYTSLVC